VVASSQIFPLKFVAKESKVSETNKNARGDYVLNTTGLA